MPGAGGAKDGEVGNPGPSLGGGVAPADDALHSVGGAACRIRDVLAWFVGHVVVLGGAGSVCLLDFNAFVVTVEIDAFMSVFVAWVVVAFIDVDTGCFVVEHDIAVHAVAFTFSTLFIYSTTMHASKFNYISIIALISS